jgi:sialate O-acetylesterase
VEGVAARLAIPAGMTPTKVRYAWADSPVMNLFGTTGLPATPFELPLP